MSLESTTALLRSRLGTDSGLGATVKFDFGAEGVIYLDGAADPNSVSNDDADAECTVQISLEDFESLVAGDLDATTAFMMGKLKVEGDMAIAMRLREVF
jgi:putative sterol carrier protein